MLARDRKERLNDAQMWIGRGIPQLTRSRDFRTFAAAAGLDVVIPAPVKSRANSTDETDARNRSTEFKSLVPVSWLRKICVLFP